jgi:hypothetical protein
MRRCLTAILVVGLVSLTSREAAAQPSDKDIAAYAALIMTPIGSHSPLLITPGTKGEKSFSSFAARFSHFSPSAGDGTNNLAASYYLPAGSNAALGFTGGYIMPSCDGCDGVMNLGADVNSTLWNSAGGASINLQGSLGWGTTDGASAMSAAIGVPLAIRMTQANKSKFHAFVTPGFGYGRVSPEGFDSESGTRPLVGAGAAWEAAAGWGLHAAFQKVIIEDGGNNFGVGFTYRMGGGK